MIASRCLVQLRRAQFAVVNGARQATVFESSHPSLFLEYFRIPYRTGGISTPSRFARLQLSARSSPAFGWRTFEVDEADPQHFVFENIPLFGRLDEEFVRN